MARSIADLRTVHEILAGTDPRDPRAAPVPPFGSLLPAPIRVAIVADPGVFGVHPDVRAAVEAVARALEDAGYEVEEVGDVPRLEETLDAYGRIILTEFALSWPMVKKLLTEDGRRYIELFMEQRPPADLDGYIQLTATLHGIRRDWLRYLESYPLVLGPVFAEPPVEPGLESRGPEENARIQAGMRLCSATSFVGVPAVAVLTGVAGRLPPGVQVIGAPYREDLCLDAAAAIEERLGTLTPTDPRT